MEQTLQGAKSLCIDHGIRMPSYKKTVDTCTRQQAKQFTQTAKQHKDKIYSHQRGYLRVLIYKPKIHIEEQKLQSTWPITSKISLSHRSSLIFCIKLLEV